MTLQTNLIESAAEAELNRLISSPPPKFEFLRDAEEKLLKRLLEESERKPLCPAMAAEVREGSFLGFLYAKNNYNNREVAAVHPLPQVIPLASSSLSSSSSAISERY